MKKEAVFHLNTENFIYPISRNRLHVRLRTAREDIDKAMLIYFSRTCPDKKHEYSMEKNYSDNLFDYYDGLIETDEVARYQKYYFRLTDYDGNTEYVGSKGITNTSPEDDFFEFLYTNPDDVVDYPDWAKGTVYYQIFPERFANGDRNNDPPGTMQWGSKPTRENFMGGDLKGIRDNIPYLKNLGIETIYINPIFEADFNHKYATTDYYRVDPIFGKNSDLKILVQELHKNGIRILLDGVFNHVGIHFRQFEDVLEKGRKSEFYDWFLVTSDDGDISVTHKDYECVGAYKYMPKLNSSNPAVRKYILEVMDFWIREYGIDGWRLDVADEVDKRVWQEASTVLKEKYPNIILLGETWGYGGELVDDKKLDSVMNYMFRDAVRDYFGFQKIKTTEFANRIGHMLALYKEETAHMLYNLFDSHDTERFLFYCEGDKKKLQMAVAFQILFIGSPAIYYGDEVGLTGDNDPDCRKCMIWGDEQDSDLLNWYKSLIKLRKNHSAIRKGRFRLIYADDQSEIICFRRWDNNENITVLIRMGGKQQSVTYSIEEGKELLTGESITGNVSLEKYSIKVIESEGGYENERT